MVCLNFSVKKWIAISLSVIVVFWSGCTHEQNDVAEKITDSSQQDNKQDNTDWKIAENDSPSYDFAALYHLSEVPNLKKLFINSTFLKHVTINHIPYLHGFSSDGRFAAFISYVEGGKKGYLIQIYDTNIGEVRYTIFIPNSENMIESKELAYAQTTLDEDFKIDVPPNRLVWENGMKYSNEGETWRFSNYKLENQSYLRITNDRQKEIWQFLPPGENNQRQLELFTFPGDPNWVIFVFSYISSNDATNKSFEPLFINLKALTNHNSLKGKVREADIWLYGSFQFIYDQWNTTSKKGFFAISSDSQQTMNNHNYSSVNQWIYLDPNGEMAWYGNSRGIFNEEAKPINTFNHLFYYRINLKYDSNGESLKYFIVDQYDQKTKQLIKTYEFKWDAKLLKMIPIEKVKVYVDE